MKNLDQTKTLLSVLKAEIAKAGIKKDDEYKLDESELEPTKPLSTERHAEIEELYAQMAEING